MKDEFFKAYVATKNKQCLMPFKDKDASDLLTFEDASKLSEFAGVLDDDTVLIDVDDKAASDILLKIIEDRNLLCRVYATSRGKHFLFKRGDMIDKCSTHKFSAIGITVDVKTGNKNSYEVLKFNNKLRPVLYDILPGESYQIIPKWLTVVNVKELSFLDMKVGSGRNTELFNYILKLQNNHFTKAEAREAIEIINEYILSDPLPEKELNTILRDDAFKKPAFFNGDKFLFNDFAHYMKREAHVVRVHGMMHVYLDGVYMPGKIPIMRKMIEYIPTLKATQRKEVFEYLELIVNDNDQNDYSNFIAFKNGIYDISEDKLVDFTPDIVVTNKINFNYNPNAKSKLLETTLNKLSCNDPDIRLLLEEMAGYCLFRRNELRKSFILTGDKKNGKSTFLDLILYMLGEDNVSSLDLADLGSQFRTAELSGKLANIGDDIGDEFIKNPAIFKKVVAGDRVTVERKGVDPFQFNNYAKFLFSANDIPRIRDKTGAVLDRLIIVPFNATFDKNAPDFDPFIKYKLHKPEVIEALIQLALDGLNRVLSNQEFTTNTAVQRELEEYEENNNPIKIFLKEQGEEGIINNSTTACYRGYKEFCIVNSFTPLSQIEFSKTVKKMFRCETIEERLDGKRIRIFKKV